ncbi:MAG: hypothetical protein DRG83_00115 [Deltaproteobacteria bacterium]|nr:MAG: hypothetical protein DRG83_00115 [Deltaproteobacteria bacterium]
MFPWRIIIGPAAKLLDTILKRVLPPEKVSEKERLEITKQFELALEKQLKESEAQFFELVKTQIQSAVRTGPFAFFTAIADMLRMLVRPVVTLAWFALYAWIKINVISMITSDGFQVTDVKVIFTQYDAIIGLVILCFWFGDRAFKRAIEALREGKLKNIFGFMLR